MTTKKSLLIFVLLVLIPFILSFYVDNIFGNQLEIRSKNYVSESALAIGIATSILLFAHNMGSSSKSLGLNILYSVSIMVLGFVLYATYSLSNFGF